MTEAQAKATWCHKAIAQRTTDPTANWGWDGMCLGSRCMAWRDLFETANVREIVDNFGGGKLVTVAKLQKTGGYCGLAGKP